MRLGIFDQLHGYTRAVFGEDLLAGIVVSIILVPQSMAYADLAGLPAPAGLLAAMLPMIVYALMGSSRTLSVGPVAIASLMTLTALSQVPEGTNLSTAAALLAGLVGLCLLLLAFLKAGAVTHFVSHSVISGFTSAAAVLIILSQLKHLLGFPDWKEFQINLGVSALGLLGLSILILFRHKGFQNFLAKQLRNKPAILLTRSGPLIAISICTLGACLLTSQFNIPLVGTIAFKFSPEVILDIDLDLTTHLLPSAILIAIIGYMESIAVGRTLANQRRERLNPNQELWALGYSNLASGISSAFPVAGGFGRSVVNMQAGARTQVAALVSASIVVILSLTATGLFALIPKAALAAIVIVAVLPLIEWKDPMRLWKYHRPDACVWGITFLSVLVYSVEMGLAAGTLAALILFVARSGNPHCAVIGRLPKTEHFRNVLRYDVETLESAIFIRIDESLFFANILKIEDFINSKIATQPKVQYLFLVGTGINSVDSDGLAFLQNLDENLRVAGIRLMFAEFKGPVLDQLYHSDWFKSLSKDRLFISAQTAFSQLERIAHLNGEDLDPEE